MSDEREGGDRPRPSSESVRKAGTFAYQGLLSVLVMGLLLVIVAGLGFLVYRNRLDAGPLLLLVGIVFGFALGRLDAIL